MADRETIQRLVAGDDLEGAIEAMRPPKGGAGDRRIEPELLMQASRLSRARERTRKGLASEDDEARERTRVGYALLELLAALPSSAPLDPAPTGGPGVFISYNHADRAVAGRLASALAARGFAIQIDSDSMEPGESIRAFIQRAIRTTRATICVVSTASLLSSWVAVETLLALRRDAFDDGRRFIAVYLDETFLAPDFRLDATRRIDATLKSRDDLVSSYQAQHLDTRDVNDEIARLHDLRHGLGEILGRLRGSLLLDIRDDAFDASVDRLTESLQRQARHRS